jgi:sugar-specific transcriptional regulator TrmB
MEDFSAAGLAPTEAKVYKKLLTRKEWLPSELAENVAESRTNIYKILDRLTDLHLAERVETQKKLRYRAQNPAHLLELAREKRRQHDQAEAKLEAAAQGLVHDYITTYEQPAVKYFQGKDEIRKIFIDMFETGESLRLLRSPADITYYDPEFFTALKARRAERGIKTIALTPDVPSAIHDAQDDARHLIFRTWLPEQAYTAPVEWNISGDKVALISYGQEALGMVIESPQIAESFRQLFALAKRGAERMPTNK